MSARAALDAARAQFTAVTGAPPVAPSDASALWNAAESILQDVVQRPDLSGQALVGDARRVEALTLNDAHALVALQGWVDRVRDGVSPELAQSWTASAGGVVRDTITALEHAVQFQERVVPPPLAAARVAAGIAPPRATTPLNDAAAAWQAAGRPKSTPFLRSARGVLTITALLALAGIGGRQWSSYRVQHELDDAIALYASGRANDARTRLTAYAESHPDDARPHIYLGRIARDARDFTASREQLQSATRLAPNNAVAHRELGATLLADGDAASARRFYVRAVELDPADRLAQGFLACALHRLGRETEAQSWIARAGPGDWTSCLATPAPSKPAVLPK